MLSKTFNYQTKFNRMLMHLTQGSFSFTHTFLWPEIFVDVDMNEDYEIINIYV